jgi:hypothetical protein
MNNNAHQTQGREGSDKTIAQLRAENERLRSQLHDSEHTSRTREYGSQHRWRTVLCALFITVGAVLGPPALIASWTTVELTNTDRFVATLGPLAEKQDIRDYVTNEVVTIINNKVDINGLTQSALGALAGLGIPPNAASALQALAPAASDGLQKLLQGLVTKVVDSNAFTQVWEQALRTTHTQVAGLLSSNPSQALNANSNGTISIDLGPLIEEIKPQLESAGFPFAANIPTVDATIPLTTVTQLNQISAAYNFAVFLGNILPWISMGLIIVGVVVAKRKPQALVGASIGMFLAMMVVILAAAIGQTLFVTAVSPSIIPSNVAATVYNTVLTFVYSASLAVAIAAVIVGIVGFIRGQSRAAQWIRGGLKRQFDAIRHRLYTKGPLSVKFGAVVYRIRIVIRTIIVIGGVAVFIFWRPLTPLLVITTSLIVLVVLAVEAVLEYQKTLTPPQVG